MLGFPQGFTLCTFCLSVNVSLYTQKEIIPSRRDIGAQVEFFSLNTSQNTCAIFNPILMYSHTCYFIIPVLCLSR